jgi:predicted DNA-binding protein (MmcQ/YjbR family)
MDIETYRHFCLSLPSATEDMPFDESVLVFRVGGKIFSLLNVNDFSSVNLKCDPERAIELRENWSGIQPGYHMNKKHWNTLTTDGSVPEELIKELVQHSYDLVWRSIPVKNRPAR